MKRTLAGVAIFAIAFVGGLAAAILLVAQVASADLSHGDDWDSSAKARKVIECEPDLAQAPLTINGCAAAGTSALDVPAGRYRILVSGEQVNVRTSASCATTPATAADRTLVVGTQLPITFTATTKVCCASGSTAALGRLQFAPCRQ